MLFWFICLALTLAVAVVLLAPFRNPPAAPTESPDVAIYRSQLEELDRDVQRGVINGEEAERARTEVARRLLAASKAGAPQIAHHGTSRGIMAMIGLVVLGFSFGVYSYLGAPGYGDLPLQARLSASDEARANRPSQAAFEAAAPTPPAIEVPDDYRQAVDQLRIIVPTRPDELQGWELLAFHEAELRNYGAAAAAQARVIALKGEDATIEDRRRQLDLMVAAAGGMISPEAEAVINQIAERDDSNIAARYYLGELYYQTDRSDIAFRIWRSIVETGDPQDFHVSLARAQIEDAAFRAGLTYTLPAARGPSAEDIENAQDMAPEARAAMIGNMVANLSDRLATEGGTAADWARLINAYGVLGDATSAREIWIEARDVFGANPAAMETLRAAATSAGVLE